MRALKLAALVFALGLSSALVPADARENRRETAARNQTVQAQPRQVRRGRASYYANHFHGKRMANGKRFNRNSNAAASRTLPLGTRARVKNLENGRTAVVTIQDRGPFKPGRIIDLSPSTARKLDMMEDGVAMVEVVPLSLPNNPG
ncbi:septal ring lytic transglycosylase RlpA family protein [Roseomonas sp. M0104]|uniref:Endolytic peptidoglycan transglycosylase RlpA n=1 Tax=Teichococcus coralli TaxID=2545983 RepID=A0A845BPW8_9PROT|nr:septal ring lytic transglycosylase RlpA family protein [Pseudoroseomonas coralli]MXP65449.1 septal ring lytic transglycosylase RlpA family protein [Pseudoroseomonas coralli]